MDKMTHPIKRASQEYKLLLSIMLLASCLFISSMIYMIQINNHISQTHVRLTSAAEHILISMSQAQLWLEQYTSGKSVGSTEAIKDYIQRIQADMLVLSSLTMHSHLFLGHDELEHAIPLQQQAFKSFEKLQQHAATQVQHGTMQPSAESDVLFQKMYAQVTEIRAILHQSLNLHLALLADIELFLIILALFILVAVAWIVLSSFKRQTQSFLQVIEQRQKQNEAEAQYSALFQQSPLAIQVTSAKGRVIHVNQAWEKLWGITLLQLVNYIVLQDPLVQNSEVFADIQRGFSGESVVTPVCNYNPRSNTESPSPFTNKFVRTHIYPIKDTQGELQQFVMIFTDVTENFLLHSFQAGRNEILHHIVNPTVPLSKVLHHISILAEKHSTAMCSILLLSHDKQCLYDGASPSLPQDYRFAINGLTIGENVGSCGTATATGKLVVVSDIATDPLWEEYKELASTFNLKACWSQPIKDGKGNILGTFAMYFDEVKKPNTQDLALLQSAAQLASIAILHKQSSEHLIQSEAQLKKAQHLAKMGNWELNFIEDKLTWSDEIYHMLEIDKAQFTPSYEILMDAIHPDDREKAQQAYQSSLENKQPYEIINRYQFSDGRIKHVLERCETIFSSQGQPLKSVGTAQDISALMEAQQEKENIQSKMKHMQRLESLGVLAGGIAHDFNNILTTILGNAGLAQTKLPTSSPASGFIEKISVASQKAANLCQQMLAYSGKGSFMIKPVVLSDIVQEMTQLLHVSIAKNTVLRLDLNTQIPAVDADVTQMQQVVMNLVINAAEAIGENSGSISLTTGIIHVDSQYLASTFVDEQLEEGQYIYLEVSDTGCGMSDEVKNKLFDPFFTTKFTGRGLGMAAILGIVRGHRGAIKVYSEENKGSTFKLLFPCSLQKAVPIDAPVKELHAWQGQGCMLIVDDEETIREVASSMLADLGLQSMQAEDGIAAIEIFKTQHQEIKLVLLDMTMPRMGGEDTYSELCRINPDVKVILSSGYTEQDATNRFVGKGLAGFLQKPYTIDELSQKIDEIFDTQS